MTATAAATATATASAVLYARVWHEWISAVELLSVHAISDSHVHAIVGLFYAIDLNR